MDNSDCDGDCHSDCHDNCYLESSVGTALMSGEHGDDVLSREVAFARKLVVLRAKSFFHGDLDDIDDCDDNDYCKLVIVKYCLEIQETAGTISISSLFMNPIIITTNLIDMIVTTNIVIKITTFCCLPSSHSLHNHQHHNHVIMIDVTTTIFCLPSTDSVTQAQSSSSSPTT